MSDKIEIQGKTVEAAISEALLQMGARRDEVEIKVLEEPKSGFMGFLGGRAARVLVRKKRSRRGGRSDRDYRVDDNDYKAHNLSDGGGRSRGSSRRGSPKAQARGRDDSRQASRESGREEKSGSRRGSRGRGGRGRQQETAGRSPNQDQRSDQRPDQRQSQRQGEDQRQRQGQKQGQGQKQSQKQDQRQAQKQDRSSRPASSSGRDNDPNRRDNDRNRRGNERNRRGRPRGGDGRQDNQAQAPNERSDQARVVGEETVPRKEIPIRPLRSEPVNSTTDQAAPVTPTNFEEPKPIEQKAETSVTKPIKPRRAFGGLGARLKEKRAADKAAQVQSTPGEEPSVTPKENPISVSPSPRPTIRERRTPSFTPARVDEDVILGGIKGTKYAKQIGSVTEEGLDDALTELTDGMMARAGFPCRCETQPGEYRQIKVTTDDTSAGMLIGRHGQTIEAVEHLVERMASNAIDARARINLDINNYRMRREESLAERVGEAAANIRETGRPFHMEPMSARERRLVHMETAALGGLRTFTMEDSGGKHVVIAQEEAQGEETPKDVRVNEDESAVDLQGDGADELNNSDI